MFIDTLLYTVAHDGSLVLSHGHLGLFHHISVSIAPFICCQYMTLYDIKSHISVWLQFH